MDILTVVVGVVVGIICSIPTSMLLVALWRYVATPRENTSWPRLTSYRPAQPAGGDVLDAPAVRMLEAGR